MPVFFVGFSCEGDDSEDKGNNSDNDDNNDDSQGPDESPPWISSECIGRDQAQLLGISLIVDGEETEMPAIVFSTDVLAIAMEYSDESCKIEGGLIFINASDKDAELTDLIRYHYDIEEIGCSSAEDGPFYLYINPIDFILPEGVERNFPMEFRLVDYCYSASKPEYLPLDFTVVEE